MGKIELKKDIILSIVVKTLVLILNFAIVWLTARLWGAEGRGAIAIFIANLGIIAIVCNIFTQSSVSYFFKKVDVGKLASQAYIWVVLASAICSILCGFFNLPHSLIFLLFVVATLTGFIAFHNALFLGDQQISNYNLILLLQPALLLVCIGVFFLINKELGYITYFYSQIISLTILLIIVKILTKKKIGKFNYSLDSIVVKNSFNFGWQVELSGLLQFLNYRFSMFILERMTGLGEVGVFSIGIQITETIWIFSRSISLVQYSNVLNLGDTIKSRKETEKMSLLSFYISFACILIIILLPANFFTFIFGDEFADVKRVILLLSPGTLAIAASNVFGNYFSAIGKLKILIIKSLVGLIFTIILSYILIPQMQIQGASIVNSISYIVSSVILFGYYYFVHKKNAIVKK